MVLNKTLKLAVLSAIVMGIVVSCATAQCSAENTSNVTNTAESISGVYENSTYGFSISYPAGWIAKEADPNSMGMVVGFLAPGEDVNNPMDYVTVQTESLPSDQQITLDQYTSAVINNLKSSYKKFKLLTNKGITIGKLTGKELLYTIDNGGTPYEILLQYTIKDNNAYVLTYYARETNYIQFEDGAREIMASFEFSGAEPTNEEEMGGALLTPLPFSRS